VINSRLKALKDVDVTEKLGSTVRFGIFDADFRTQELRKEGVRVKLPQQSFQILQKLLEQPGELVTRDQLRQALWPGDTFVDFDHGLNNSIKRIRDAIGDSAETPRYIETLPRLGYRFIGSIDGKPDVPSPAPIPPPQYRWRLFTVLVLGGLLAAALTIYFLRKRIWSPPPPTLTIIPFTTFPGFEIAPSFSPDGNQIVFSWFGYEKEFKFDLFIKQVGQERVVQLTHHSATFLASAWSPDGRFIAFMRHVNAEPDLSGIYIISALGGSERKLANITPLAGWEPIGVNWSADGKWLAFAKGSSPAKKADSSPEHFSTHLVNVETTEERVLPDPSPDCVHTWQAAFSPDGKYLASVCVLTGGVANIYLQSADGKQAREVVGARSSEGFAGIAWAADSQSLLYSSDQHLWRVPLVGGKPEKLLFAQDVESVAVAPAGNRLAYAQVRHPTSIWRLELASEVKPAGPATKLISSSRGDGGSRISPDGKHIAFQSRRSGNPEVWLCDRDGSNPVQLSSFGGPQVGMPSWSPDSHRIVFDLRASGNAELYIVNVDGGPPKRFSTGTTNASGPFWSADGHWIYFNTERPETIWKAPAEGGAAVRLTGEGEGHSPLEAVDGTRVFFYKVEGGHHQAWSASINGGDERPMSGMPADVPWVPARKGLYFINGSPRHFSLNHFDFVTGQRRKIADLPSVFGIGLAAISSDGRTFFFTGVEHGEGDIVQVDGFR
jgi:Tol biopolymer transport system component/DNA-binding winged helix-turn-helix (wHTH) protein